MAIENKSYDEFCEILNKKINLGELITIEENLENLGMKDKTLEDFLEEEGIFQRMSKTEKLEKVGELKNFYSKRRGSGASEKSKLLESYRIILNDINKEKEYDNYLKKVKYAGVNQILKNSKEVYKRDGRLKLNQIENYVSQINLKIKNESDARNIFYGFCREEGIPYTVERDYKNTENENKKSQEDEEEKYERNYNSDSNDTENENRRSQEDRKERYRRNYNSNSNENKSERAEVKMNAKDAKVLFYLSLVCLFSEIIFIFYFKNFSFFFIDFNWVKLNVFRLVIMTIILLIYIKSILIKKSRLLNYKYPFYSCLVYILKIVLMYFCYAKTRGVYQAFENAFFILDNTKVAFLIMSLIKNYRYVFDEDFEVTEKFQMKISFWMNGMFLLFSFGLLILINNYENANNYDIPIKYLDLFKGYNIILVLLMSYLNFENECRSYYICLLMYFILIFLDFNDDVYETSPYKIVLVVLIILMLYRIIKTLILIIKNKLNK